MSTSERPWIPRTNHAAISASKTLRSQELRRISRQHLEWLNRPAKAGPVDCRALVRRPAVDKAAKTTA
jgi:hypothetical protein